MVTIFLILIAVVFGVAFFATLGQLFWGLLKIVFGAAMEVWKILILFLFVFFLLGMLGF